MQRMRTSIRTFQYLVFKTANVQVEHFVVSCSISSKSAGAGLYICLICKGGELASYPLMLLKGLNICVICKGGKVRLICIILPNYISADISNWSKIPLAKYLHPFQGILILRLFSKSETPIAYMFSNLFELQHGLHKLPDLKMYFWLRGQCL